MYPSRPVRSVILGTGACLPERVVTNEELSLTVDTSDAWITERTGIRQRYIAAEGELTSDLATGAAKRALKAAGLTVESVDLIVCATSTPDNTFPATATAVQRKLGVRICPAFDLQAVCSGFVYGLSVVDAMLRSGQATTALLIGAETFSRILDWDDRGTCVLFGDGAGAVVLRAEPDQGRGVLATRLAADGSHYNQLYVDGGAGSDGRVGHLRMQGREVFRHAVGTMSGSVKETLRDIGLETADIDWLVPHQANRRIMDAVGRKLGLGPERVLCTVDRHANTSAASIPLALAEGVANGSVRQGQLVALTAMGGGFTWGAAAIRW